MDRNVCIMLCTRQYCKIINLFTFKAVDLCLFKNNNMKYQWWVKQGIYWQVCLTKASDLPKALHSIEYSTSHYKNKTLQIMGQIVREASGGRTAVNHLII